MERAWRQPTGQRRRRQWGTRLLRCVDCRLKRVRHRCSAHLLLLGLGGVGRAAVAPPQQVDGGIGPQACRRQQVSQLAEPQHAGEAIQSPAQPQVQLFRCAEALIGHRVQLRCWQPRSRRLQSRERACKVAALGPAQQAGCVAAPQTASLPLLGSSSHQRSKTPSTLAQHAFRPFLRVGGAGGGVQQAADGA